MWYAFPYGLSAGEINISGYTEKVIILTDAVPSSKLVEDMEQKWYTMNEIVKSIVNN